MLKFWSKTSIITSIVMSAFAYVFLLATPANAVGAADIKDGSQNKAAECGVFWPTSGEASTVHIAGTNDWSATFRFTLTAAQIDSLRCVSGFLEIDFPISGFDVPSEWDSYGTQSNLGGIHDVAAFDFTQQSPAVTGISTADLVPNKEYYASVYWSNVGLRPSEGPPKVSVQWIPSHWAQNTEEQVVCSTSANNWAGAAWCLFGSTRIKITSNIFDGQLPINGINYFSYTPTTETKTTGTITGYPEASGSNGTSTAAVPDVDYDGILNAYDSCPNQAGLVVLLGCPEVRYSVIRTGNTLLGKNSLTDAWAQMNPSPVGDFKVSGTRVAWTDTNGNLFAKDGLTAPWVQVYSPVSQYAFSSSLFVIRGGTSLHGKAGSLTSSWVWNFNPTPATDVKVSGNRIAYTDTNGQLWAKDGLTGTWVNIYGPVNQYAISPSLVVIRTGGNLYGKTDLTSPWVLLNPTPAVDVGIAGSRITYTDSNGNLWAKDGLHGTWYNEYGPVNQYATSSTLLVVRTGTTVLGKTNLNDNWVTLNGTPATSITVAGNRIMYTDINGNLWAKDGLTGSWVNIYGPVNQFLSSSNLQ